MQRLVVFLAAFLLPLPVVAHPVITEVLWAGSDLGTTDEWVEISNPDADDIDLTGFTLTSINTKGEHVLAFRFSSGTVLPSSTSIIIARKAASASRLLLEPAFIAPDLTLPNTSLLLRLRDPSGEIIDEVDDGSGVPFAGANPSGSGAKASMERIDAFTSGVLRENWSTATLTSGLDEGARVFATPGSLPSPGPPPDQRTCVDPLKIAIALQSGPLSAVGKVTVNFQALAIDGTLPSAACRWDFGDGFQSTSCNPPSHTFALAGTYSVRLDVTNQCGDALTALESVTVFPDGTPSSQGSPYDDGAALSLVSALPNPEGADTGHEWISIRNPGELPANLAGWKIRIGTVTYRTITLKGSIDPHAVFRIYDSEQKLSLPNTESEIVLLSPAGLERSSIRWKKADEEREYYPEDLRSIPVRGQVIRVIGSTVMEVRLEPDSARKNGDDLVYVKLLGITPFPLTNAERVEQRLEDFSNRVRGKSVELEFDEELWDGMGRLLAYVYTDEQLSLQEQLLVTGDWMVDRTQDFRMKTVFLERESPEIIAMLHQDDLRISGAFTEEKYPSDISVMHEELPRVYLSEIFASPDPKIRDDSGSLISQEWLEVETKEILPQSLSGLILQSGSSKKRLGSGLEVSSESHLIISLSALGLSLRNAGATISILTPSGTVIDSVAYPKLAYGTSFSFDRLSWCISTQPTPGERNVCSDDRAHAEGKKPVRPRTALSPAVRKYAASYRADLAPGDAVMHSIESRPAPTLPVLVLTFIAGSVFSILMIGLFLIQKRKSEVLLK